MANRKTERAYENLVYVIFIAAFSFLLKTAFDKKPLKVSGMQSMTFPKGIFVIMLVFCTVKFILNLIEIIAERESEEKFEHLHPVKLLLLTMILVYASMWNVIGFGLSSAVFITLASKLLRRTCSWLKAILVGVGSTAFIYIVFGFLFNVDFPEPILNLIL